MYINHPEEPIFPHKLVEQGYFYIPDIQLPWGDTPAHIASVSSIPCWDVRRNFYSKLIDATKVPTKVEKETLKDLFNQIEVIAIKKNKLTDEEVERIYNKQDLEDVEHIRSREEIKKSFELPRRKYTEQIQDLQKQVDEKLKVVNQRYFKEVQKVNVEKVIRDEFTNLQWLMLPPVQVNRLVSIWTKMASKVNETFLANGLFGDELSFFNIIPVSF